MSPTESNPQSNHVLWWDEYDEEHWHGVSDSPNIEKVIEEGEDLINARFGQLTSDVFGSLFQIRPDFVGGELPQHLERNKILLEEMMESQEYKEFRTHSRLDTFSSAVGTISMTENILEHIRNNPQDKEAFEQSPEGSPGEDQGDDDQQEGEGQEEGEDKEGGKQGSSAQQSKEQKEAEERRRATVRKVVRKALKQAKEDVEQIKAAFGGYGLEDADLQHGGAELQERMKLAERIKGNPHLLEIAQLAGKLSRITLQKRQTQYTEVSEEIYDLELGNDIEHLTASELANLSIEELEDDFYRRFAEGSLQQYKLRGREKLGKGPVVVAIDSSGSMGGHRDVWSKAVVLAILRIAEKENRVVHYLNFNTSIQDEVTLRPGTPKDKIMDLIARGVSGGTNFQIPLQHAVNAINDDTTTDGQGGLAKADVVFITDGECHVDEHWSDEFKRLREEREVNVVTVLVGHSGQQDTIDRISDNTVDLVPVFQEAEKRDSAMGEALISL